MEIKSMASALSLHSSLINQSTTKNNMDTTEDTHQQIKSSDTMLSNNFYALDYEESKYIAAKKSSFKIESQLTHSKNNALYSVLEAAGGVSATYQDANPTMSENEIKNAVKGAGAKQQLQHIEEERNKAADQQKEEQQDGVEASSTLDVESAAETSPASSSSAAAAPEISTASVQNPASDKQNSSEAETPSKQIASLDIIA